MEIESKGINNKHKLFNNKMKSFVCSLLGGAVVATTMKEVLNIENGDKSGDGKRNFAEICAENGFSYEEHRITTSDGYILTQFRIPGLVGDTATGKPPLFF